MKQKLKKQMILKDGTTYAKGTMFEIKPPSEDKPSVAIIVDPAGREIRVGSASLYKKFSGFENPTAAMSDPDFDSCVVPSLKGEMVEPDGWDENGWPSILLAIGMI
jgi:hypothetical protein